MNIVCYLRPTLLCSAGAVVAMALLVAGCGGSSRNDVAQLDTATTNTSRTSSATRSSAALAQTRAVVYSRCLRSNGVPKYPDPNSNGNLPKGNAQTFAVTSSQYQAAEQACSRLLPSGGSASLQQCLMTGDCPRSVVQPALEEGRKFARCMRSHGVRSWPDPTLVSIGRPSFPVTKAGMPIDATRSPQMLSKIGDCQRQPGAVLLRQE